MKTLVHWRTIRCPADEIDGRYKAPEMLDHFHLAGIVDGKSIKTSRVVKATGRDVWTASGSHYHLGPVAPDFAMWLAEHGCTIDEANPVKLVPERQGN